jgi:hypothetical protein
VVVVLVADVAEASMVVVLAEASVVVVSEAVALVRRA